MVSQVIACSGQLYRLLDVIKKWYLFMLSHSKKGVKQIRTDHNYENYLINYVIR